MAAPEIRYDPESVSCCAGNETVAEISSHSGDVMAALEAVAEATVASFERALADYKKRDAGSL